MTPATAEEWEIRYRQAAEEANRLRNENRSLEVFSETTMGMALRWQDRAIKAERDLSGRRTKSPTPSGGGPWGTGRQGPTHPADRADTDDILVAVWAVTIAVGAVMGLGLWKLGELIAQVIA